MLIVNLQLVVSFTTATLVLFAALGSFHGVVKIAKGMGQVFRSLLDRAPELFSGKVMYVVTS